MHAWIFKVFFFLHWNKYIISFHFSINIFSWGPLTFKSMLICSLVSILLSNNVALPHPQPLESCSQGFVLPQGHGLPQGPQVTRPVSQPRYSHHCRHPIKRISSCRT